MTTLTVRKSIRIPTKAVGLGVALAGVVLTASVAIILANPAARDTSIAPATSNLFRGVPHQVAPIEGIDDAPVRPPRVLPRGVLRGVPHQVAPIEGIDDAPVNPPKVPGASRVLRGVPHQVAPIAGIDG
jgi:hypothetical protein